MDDSITQFVAITGCDADRARYVRTPYTRTPPYSARTQIFGTIEKLSFAIVLIALTLLVDFFAVR